MIKRLSILGAGLLGASIMKAAKARKIAAECVAWSRSAETREVCRKSEFCDAVFESPQDAVAGADVVVVCVPVNRIVPLLRECVPAISRDALITDVGSTKALICDEANRVLPEWVRFVGSHPMAGSELNGIHAARADLFENHLCFIADDERSRKTDAQAQAVRFWEAAGMRTRLVDPKEHDAIVAHVSHLPHSIAAVLSATLSEKPLSWRECGAGGLRDTTRVSAGDPHVWQAILEENRNEILPALALFKNNLDMLIQALQNGDSDTVLALLSAASQWRLPLSQKKHS